MINLNELEFKSVDFFVMLTHLFFKRSDTESIGHMPMSAQSEYLAEEANRILRERLEKADVFYCSMGGFHPWQEVDFLYRRGEVGPATHQMRVVCIEELK